jgi:starch-binding outer membrane protein, SusD/RagB family
MNKLIKYRQLSVSILLAIVLFSSCKKLYDTNQELRPNESQLYTDWSEYRAAAMGLYALQQKLVEQLVILGELRGDLLQITPNADADMVEIYNFSVSKNNKYASPVNFFKLISACNSFIRTIQTKHPEVLESTDSINVYYDNVYGEALCMRAWAYFNAARIYGRVPYIPEQLTTIEQIEGYVNSSGTYTDSVFIKFNIDGYHNDTIRKDTTFEKKYYDLSMIIDVFTNQLEKGIKKQKGTYGVGVNYGKDNNDATWEVTTWHTYSMFALLGQMYLTEGNYSKAAYYFDLIISNQTLNDLNSASRYNLNSTFAYSSWSNIFTNISPIEHIFTIWFNKDNYQTNQLQTIFENQLNTIFVNKFMLKPTKIAVSKWESCWRNQVIDENTTRPELSKMRDVGVPQDIYRGYKKSYICTNNSDELSEEDYTRMITARKNGDLRGANAIMDGMDTLVYKYFLRSRNYYSNDAYYIVYRAASIHLYMAEIYVNWMQDGLKSENGKIEGLVNDGTYYKAKLNKPMGVRGRVELVKNPDKLINYGGISTNSVIYKHDPYTNKIIGYTDYTENQVGKRQYLEDQVLNERALELAFEGERFYDLMRIAKRRNDPKYLASKVSAKFPADKQQAMYNFLLNENNWYINYFK